MVSRYLRETQNSGIYANRFPEITKHMYGSTTELAIAKAAFSPELCNRKSKVFLGSCTGMIRSTALAL
jgi:hypothetical protein